MTIFDWLLRQSATYRFCFCHTTISRHRAVGNVYTVKNTGIGHAGIGHASLFSRASLMSLLSAGEDPLIVGTFCFTFLTNFALVTLSLHSNDCHYRDDERRTHSIGSKKMQCFTVSPLRNFCFCCERWCCFFLLVLSCFTGSYQWFLILQEKRLPIVMMRAAMVQKKMSKICSYWWRRLFKKIIKFVFFLFLYWGKHFSLPCSHSSKAWKVQFLKFDILGL